MAQDVELTVLRARAVCASCTSKLPRARPPGCPADSDDVWYETCGRFEQVEQAEASVLGETRPTDHPATG